MSAALQFRLWGHKRAIVQDWLQRTGIDHMCLDRQQFECDIAWGNQTYVESNTRATQTNLAHQNLQVAQFSAAKLV